MTYEGELAQRESDCRLAHTREYRRQYNTRMSFFSLLDAVRPEIESALVAKLEQAKSENAHQFPLDDWLFESAAQRVTQGKMMRGGLLIGMFEAFGGVGRMVAVQAATAIELYGTGLLMQDDVTDRSKTRRGLPTVHVEAQQWAQTQALSDPEHFGFNCGIYVADVLYFLAHELLNSLPIEPQKIRAINSICVRQLWLLGLAQLEDLRVSLRPTNDTTVTQSHILKMYAGKTGRYSIAWPLQVGGVLADIQAETIEQLAQIGEQIGVLFQLRDDELGLFGDAAVTGKSVDDDIREGKKTLYWLHLREVLPATDPRWEIFGNSAATSAEVDQVRQFLRESGAEQTVRQLMLQQQAQLNEVILAKKFPTAVQQVLVELLSFVLERTK